VLAVKDRRSPADIRNGQFVSSPGGTPRSRSASRNSPMGPGSGRHRSMRRHVLSSSSSVNTTPDGD
jgi:hypothetical protein